MRIKKTYYLIYICGLLLAPVFCIMTPADFFDQGQSICLSVLLFDSTCYGCGMTRAIQHLFHFDLAAAYNYNKLSIVVFPLLTFVWASEIKRLYKKIKPTTL